MFEKINQKLDKYMAEHHIVAEAYLHLNGQIQDVGESNKFSKHVSPYLVSFQQAAQLDPDHYSHPFPMLRFTYEQGINYHAVKVEHLGEGGYIRLKTTPGQGEGFRDLVPKLVAHALLQSDFRPWLEARGLVTSYEAIVAGVSEQDPRLVLTHSQWQLNDEQYAGANEQNRESSQTGDELLEDTPAEEVSRESVQTEEPDASEDATTTQVRSSPCIDGLVQAWQHVQQGGSCAQGYIMWHRQAREAAQEADDASSGPVSVVEQYCMKALYGQADPTPLWDDICDAEDFAIFTHPMI